MILRDQGSGIRDQGSVADGSPVPSRIQDAGFRDQGSVNVILSERSEPKDLCILTEPAYGKLNLTLDVLGRRADGYHDLRMVMCSVELHDDIQIELGTGAESCVCVSSLPVGASIARPRAADDRPYSGTRLHLCHSEERSEEKSEPVVRSFDCACGSAQDDRREDLPQGAENLAYRAARAYFDAAGIDPDGFAIRITKRIPMQAGMAGGSSDAAAVLRALNRRYRAFSDAELREIGLRLGSDVPYCLFGGVALAEGRGERLTRLPDLPEGLTLVLVQPDFSVSTPALFAALDASAGIRDQGSGIRGAASKADVMRSALRSGDALGIGRALSNDFTSVLARDYPVVETVKKTLAAQGALGAELTGTGSVVFGLFDDPAKAEAAAALLAAHYPFTTITKFLQKEI